MGFKLVILPFIFLSSLSFASYELKFKKAVELLKNDLAQDVKTLQRPIRLYHWGSLPEFAEERKLQPDDPAWINYLSQRNNLLSDFFLTYDTRDLAGSGMYFSADPYKSRGYGDVLFEATIDKGVNFLDIRSKKDRYHIIERETYLALKNICDGIDHKPSLRGRSYVKMKKEHFQRFPECRHVFNQALSELNVQFYGYYWIKTRRYGACVSNRGGTKRDHEDVAGYVLGGKVKLNSLEADDISIDLSSMKFRVYTPSLYDGKSAETMKQLISAGDENAYRSYYVDYLMRYQRAEGDYEKIYKSGGLWEAFDELYPYKAEELVNEMKNQQMNCGDRYSEDAVF